MQNDNGCLTMRKWLMKLFLAAAAVGMYIPMNVSAAGKDSVTLQQKDDQVAVSVSLSNAKEENISALSISFQIEVEGDAGSVQPEFVFADDLAGASDVAADYRYRDGMLNIYVASDGALFDDQEELVLGNLKLTSADSEQTAAVTVSYVEDSFLAANSGYGTKVPVVTEVSDPVTLQIGKNAGSGSQGSDPAGDSGSQGNDPAGGDSGSQGNDPAGGGSSGQGSDPAGGDSGSQGSDSAEGGSGSQGNGEGAPDNNSQDGLYDSQTQFQNDPSDAQNIPSNVVKADPGSQGLQDLTHAAGAGTGNAPQLLPVGGSTDSADTGGTDAGQAGSKEEGKRDSKVTVIDPKDGPSGLLVSGAASGGAAKDSAGLGETQGVADAGDEDSLATKPAEEIVLDRENGSVLLSDGQGKENGIFSMRNILLVVLSIVIVTLAAVMVVVILRENSRKKRRRAKRRTQKGLIKNG